jgi:hypothetical protein
MRGLAAVAVSLAALGCSSATDPAPTINLVGTPPNWNLVGQNPALATTKFSIGLATSHAHGGSGALVIYGSDTANLNFSGVGQGVRADNYRGKRVRFSAWVRHEGLRGRDIGLWMRVDGLGATMAFDNFSTRSLAGTSGWHEVEIILDIAEDAIGISFGALMQGGGTLVVDDMKWEVVAPTGPSTNQFIAPQPSALDAQSAYFTARLAPVNMDFESRSP